MNEYSGNIDNINVHYDEFTLDQHAFGSPAVENEQSEFQGHIKKCNRCRRFYGDLKSFYILMDKKHPELTGQKLLIKGSFQLPQQKYPDISSSNIVKFTKNFPFHLKEYIFEYKKPLFAGFSFACLLLCAILAPSYLFKDNNPVHTKFNNSNRMVEVYNQNWDKLWEKSYNGNTNSLEMIGLDQACQLVDIDGDKKNEMVSALTLLDKNNSKYNVIQIFNYKGELIKSREFGNTFSYNGENYLNTFYTWGMLVKQIEKDKDKDIIFTLQHIHSPSSIIRVDKDLNILGEYWHYGHFDKLYSVDFDNNGNKKIIVTGFEDKTRTGVFAVLDPLKINGKTQATQTSGYELSSSNAEEFYVRLPLPKEMSFLYTRPMVSSIVPESLKDSTIGFVWKSNASWDPAPGSYRYECILYYYFTKDMKPVKINSTDKSDLCYKELLKAGKIKSLPDKTYFENLMKEIEYWNGKEWKKEWCRVGQ
jgi:hypothetical protein